MTTNVVRQPNHCAAMASGVPASTTPIMLRLNTQLIAVAQRLRGYQREHMTTTDMKLPPKPKPSRNRAAISSLPSRTVACHSAPATPSPARMPTVHRTPMRSNMMPTGTCADSSATKKIALASPSTSGVSFSSTISSGAMTVSVDRKNCDRIVVADSMTIRIAAARAGGFEFTVKSPAGGSPAAVAGAARRTVRVPLLVRPRNALRAESTGRPPRTRRLGVAAMFCHARFMPRVCFELCDLP